MFVAKKKINKLIEDMDKLKESNCKLLKKVRGIENKKIIKKYKKLVGEVVEVDINETDRPITYPGIIKFCFFSRFTEGKLIDLHLDSDNYIIATIEGNKSKRIDKITKLKQKK